jgi:predicted nucleic acid-binding protein
MAMRVTAVTDTNAILALLNAKDPNHVAARGVLPIEFLLPSLVLPEVDYLATTRLGANVARAFQKAVIRGDFEIIHNTNADFA